jgi:flagellar basal-body rod modification protein FlgD
VNVTNIQTDAATAPPEAQPGPTASREDFLNLLVAQLQHQDPLQPMEGTEFVTQLAQFSSVEQLLQINERLGLIEVGQASAVNSQATALVGRQVTVRADAVQVTEQHVEDESAPIRIELDGEAESVTVTITNEFGRVVGTVSAQSLGPGSHELAWNGELPDPGTYRLSVDARDASGAPVDGRGLLSATVTEVSFEHGYPELLIDDIRVRLADIVSVGASQPEGA